MLEKFIIYITQIKADAKAAERQRLANQAEQLNMKGILLHVMGDFLGSIVVCLSAGLMYFYNNCDDSNDLSNCAFHAEGIDQIFFISFS